jgi:hypothetical protein
MATLPIGQADFDPLQMVKLAALNPAVPIVGLIMGRAADQWQKLVVAAFAAAFAGSVLLWIASYVRLVPVHGLGTEAGAFIVHYLLGLLWAGLGYAILKRPPS